MVGTFQDVTERKRAERRLETQYAVARVLEEATNFEEASSRILQTVCESLEWDVGVFWHLDRRVDELRCVRTWHDNSLGPSTRDGAMLAARGIRCNNICTQPINGTRMATYGRSPTKANPS